MVARARLFREEHEPYIKYVDGARDLLCAMVEARLQELKQMGVVGETHDALLNQLRGLRSRFVDVDAMTRSLLLQIEGNDPHVWEEVLAFIGGLVSLELEARSAQKRVALAAVFRDYMGGHSIQMRDLNIAVESYTAKRFHSLTNEIREIQSRVYGRQDPFTHRDLFERLLALGDANKDFVARMGAPTIFNVEYTPGRPE